MFISSRSDATHQCEELKTCPSGTGTSRFEVFYPAPAAMADGAAPSILCELLKAEEGGVAGADNIKEGGRCRGWAVAGADRVGKEAGAEEPSPLLRTTSGREAGEEEPSPLLWTASAREAGDGHRRGEGGCVPWIGEVGAGRRGGGT